MRRVLITGGCGFIGANLCAHLAESGGTRVRVLDNESLGRREHLDGLPVEFQHGDIRDPDAVHAALEGVDAVVHLAADTRVMDSIAAPARNFDANVVGTFRLLEGMRSRGVKRLISASTGGAILGEATPPVDETMVPQPLSPYGASKLACEGYCSAFSGAYGLAAASLRFSNVYGPRSYHKGSVVAHFLKRILAGRELVVYGDGSQTRDYVFVEDLCAGIVQALRSDRSGVFQLGTGRATSINDLIDSIRAIVGSQHTVEIRYAEFRQGEIRHTWCNVDKARHELGYDPVTSLDDGLRRTWDWFQSAFAGATTEEE